MGHAVWLPQLSGSRLVVSADLWSVQRAGAVCPGEACLASLVSENAHPNGTQDGNILWEHLHAFYSS